MRKAVLIGLLMALADHEAQAQTSPPAPDATEVRELVQAAKATAKAAREGADAASVVPDILTQVLAKLDKLENKLDKIEDLKGKTVVSTSGTTNIKQLNEANAARNLNINIDLPFLSSHLCCLFDHCVVSV